MWLLSSALTLHLPPAYLAPSSQPLTRAAAAHLCAADRPSEEEAKARWLAGQNSQHNPPPPSAAASAAQRSAEAEAKAARSPGLQNNFYDIPTADFKRPHGAAPAGEAPGGAPGGEAPGGAEPAAEWEEAPPAGGSGPGATVPAAYGAESPVPGREREYEAFKAQAGAWPEEARARYRRNRLNNRASASAPGSGHGAAGGGTAVSGANDALIESICMTIDALAAVTAGDPAVARRHFDMIQGHAAAALLNGGREGQPRRR
ncbi:hypothetical protein EMIHUDRAFT_210946 [Emiliania huxleyi CCMP1516]|uniref:Uncharacterized protein n=2 Tax=Emiliania huxleyi TaxID=2903 RepID=A0A0D3IXJ8_EMIH1|nr:hypothetical protein EMIHUDRAFT_210946 [Emiliania huxleyi CCMP1516]EOD15983.1 hypothetical protein EMIHUDRAFT_210946 [Emiliania huxleyi CCMP1516]|eukprot:XP_005768412.1 hypothetical protein EMIHUDRAFT_210946 [Emiliania huxleyi CCMP1516]